MADQAVVCHSCRFVLPQDYHPGDGAGRHWLIWIGIGSLMLWIAMVWAVVEKVF